MTPNSVPQPVCSCCRPLHPALTGADSGTDPAVSPLPRPPLSAHSGLLRGNPAGKRLGREQHSGP